MKITYYGTAAAEGIPGTFCSCEYCLAAKKTGGENIRSRSQALIDDCLLVDLPADTYMHMLHGGLPLPHIEHLLVTHSHQDHFYPQELVLRREPFCHGLKKKICVYGNDQVKTQFDAAAKMETCPTDLQVEFRKSVPFAEMRVGSHTVLPLLANHAKTEECLIYLIRGAGKTLLYANDTGWFPAQTWKALEGTRIDLVSLDCTMLKHKDGNNHMGIADNIEVCARLREMGCISAASRVVITHFSHNGGLLHHEIVEAVKSEGMFVAYDGYTVEF